MAFDGQTFWGARGRSGRPLPRWLRARLSRRRRATVDGQGHAAPRAPGQAEPAEPQPDAPTERPMTVEALLRVVQSVADDGFGPGPVPLDERLRD